MPDLDPGPDLAAALRSLAGPYRRRAAERARERLAGTLDPADLAAARVVDALHRLTAARDAVTRTDWTPRLTPRDALDYLAATGAVAAAVYAALDPAHPAAARDAAVDAYRIADTTRASLAARASLNVVMAGVDGTLDALTALADALAEHREG